MSSDFLTILTQNEIEGGEINKYKNTIYDSAFQTSTTDNQESIEGLLVFVKFFLLLIIIAVTLLFGFLPLLCVKCRRSTKILGLANAFSGGLFMGIALFHLLPESGESLADYFEKNNSDSDWAKLPTSFFIAFISYSLILFVEKIAFDSHSITEHDHGGHQHSEHHSHNTKYADLKATDLAEPLLSPHHLDEEQEKRPSKTLTNELEPIQEDEREKTPVKNNSKNVFTDENENINNHVSDKRFANKNQSNGSLPVIIRKGSKQNSESSHSSKKYLHHLEKIKKRELGYEEEDEDNQYSQDEDEDIDEQIMKNVVSSKGKFSSYMQARNLFTSPRNHKNVDKGLLTASKILERTHANRQDSIDGMCVTNLSLAIPQRKSSQQKSLKSLDKYINIGETKPDKLEKLDESHVHEKPAEHHFNPKSNITPYLLLIALSVHGLFEGTALGVQKEMKDAIFLGVAILAHKWAEAFTLGISFSKSGTPRESYIKMIILFSIFTPMGILIGVFLLGADPLTQGIFLAISAGTFIYISASEVIVEEFAITKYRYQKYFLYLCGGVLVGLLSYMEVVNGHEH